MNLPFDILSTFGPLLFFISFYGLITSRNVIKSIVFVIIMQTSVIIIWLGIGASHGTTPPILTSEEILTYGFEGVSDPLPQALMLTAIVIGISVTAIIITMLNALFRKYGSTDWDSLNMKAKSLDGNINKEEEAC